MKVDSVHLKEGTSKEYVYLFPNGILHTSGKCPKLNYKGVKTERVLRNDTSYLRYKNNTKGISFCPYCVNDKDFESLNGVIYSMK